MSYKVKGVCLSDLSDDELNKLLRTFKDIKPQSERYRDLDHKAFTYGKSEASVPYAPSIISKRSLFYPREGLLSNILDWSNESVSWNEDAVTALKWIERCRRYRAYKRVRKRDYLHLTCFECVMIFQVHNKR